MTARKPPGLGWESWIDRQIREAIERGELDDLPGAGEPLPDLDEPYDEMWWVRRKLGSEGLTLLPPSLALRREARDAFEAASRARSEAEVRRLIGHVNEQIREANRDRVADPVILLVPYDVDRAVKDWREQHEGSGSRRTGRDVD
jgi:hypothetical protein